MRIRIHWYADPYQPEGEKVGLKFFFYTKGMFKILDFLFVFSDFYSFNFLKKVKNSLFLATFWQFLPPVFGSAFSMRIRMYSTDSFSNGL